MNMLRSVLTRSAATARASSTCALSRRALATSAGSRVKILGSDDAYTQITAQGSGRKAIVYFTAKWCPPCKMISPIYDELSTAYPEIEFAKVDVDELNDTTAKAGVRSMPTFFAFDDGQLKRELSFSGADEALLRSNIKQLNDL